MLPDSIPAVERSRGLAARYYTDPEVFADEMERIFARSWVMVGHVSQVAEPGAVITADVGDESVLVANDGGQLRAMYNVCQHRGHQLMTAEQAQVDQITCPYHAWTYGLDGRLLHARGESVGEVCVPSVRLETQGGFMFVNLDPGTAPLAETAAGVEEEMLALAPDLGQRVLAARNTHEMRANWKVVVENYNECYHCPNVHKWFTSGVISPGSYRISMHGDVIRHTAVGPQMRPGGGNGSAGAAGADNGDGSAGEAYGDGSAGAGAGGEAYGYGSFYTWPVSSIQCYPGQVINTFRWVPLAVDRTRLIREWWFPSVELTDEQSTLIAEEWSNTAWEDFVIVESVQRGVSSRGYRPGPLILDPSGCCDVHSENSVQHLQGLLLASLNDAG